MPRLSGPAAHPGAWRFVLPADVLSPLGLILDSPPCQQDGIAARAPTWGSRQVADPPLSPGLQPDGDLGRHGFNGLQFPLAQETGQGVLHLL